MSYYFVRKLSDQDVSGEKSLGVALGRRLRGARVAQSRTLASVAVEAGLSVPYVANLESGRGNPTLSALQGLARALGVPLAELVREDATTVAEAARPASLARFVAGARFRREVRWLADDAGGDADAVRRDVLASMDVLAATEGELDETDWHRVLDALILARRRRMHELSTAR